MFSFVLSRDRCLQEQLYEQLLGLIASAQLAPGTRLPSTRFLAKYFDISRTTVLITYERLIADGYLETFPACGTFVTKRQVCPAPSAGSAGSVCSSRPEAISPEPACLEQAAPDCDPGGLDHITGEKLGYPDPSLFPVNRWRRLLRSAVDRIDAQRERGHKAGRQALRVAVAAWLVSSRGLSVAPEQVLLLNSRQQALHMVAHLTLQSGARAVVEDPCDANAAAALAGQGAELVRIPTDTEGLCTSHLPAGDFALAYVTPEHQGPLGVVMAQQRRIALLNWAERNGSLILEEDFGSQLHHHENMHPSLMGMDRHARVIHLGSFCASLGPWIRLAYVIIPRNLIGDANALLSRIDDCRGSLEETALAMFLDNGDYARHLHGLSKAYGMRRDTMLAALDRHFGAAPRTWGEQAGLHLVWFPPGYEGSSSYLAALARSCGLEAAALAAETRVRLSCGRAVLLGFGSLQQDEIVTRVARFAAIVQENTPNVARTAG